MLDILAFENGKNTVILILQKQVRNMVLRKIVIKVKGRLRITPNRSNIVENVV
jgi:hypothetical protein